jgi:hypothetical protein
VAVSPELEQIVAELRPIAGEIAHQLVAEELDRLDDANRPGSLSSAALEAADRSRPAGGKKPYRRHPEPAEPGAGTPARSRLAARLSTLVPVLPFVPVRLFAFRI